MPLTVTVSFSLNGTKVTSAVDVTESALDLLRRNFDLAGAKLACGEGECGACTVIVDGRSRNSCLMPAPDIDGRTVLTVEGLWTEQGIDPVQQAFIDEGAVQCGFCTPGMIMQARYLIDRNPNMSEEQIARGIEGNICRCTGYKKIIAAVAAASEGSTS
ncbi:MAG: (2Fe-2S)-binding protein [Hyphomicrobiales bacterium]|nr:(2Fe-2S)-binding protein [Hyphomicrobiales bacterium]